MERGQADGLTHLCPLCFGRTGSQRHCLLFPSLESSQDKKLTCRGQGHPTKELPRFLRQGAWLGGPCSLLILALLGLGESEDLTDRKGLRLE